MIRLAVRLAVPGIIAATLFALPAFAQFGASKLNIQGFCDKPAERQTVLYVDDTILSKSDARWFETLDARLRSTLLPHETVTLVRLSPAQGRSKELWRGCWPDFTAEERQQIERGQGGMSSWFTSNPVKNLPDMQAVFRQQLQAAMGQIFTDAARESILIDPARPPERSYLRALASDGGRFGRNPIHARVILYADLLETSEYTSVFKQQDAAQWRQQAEAIAPKLGIDFGRASLHAFGIGSSLRQPGALPENAIRFWRAFIQTANGNPGFLGADLAIPAKRPDSMAIYEIETAVNKRNLDGRILLFADRDGVLHDSYAFLRGQFSAPLHGSFLCNPAGQCRLEAKVGAMFLFSTEGESFDLKGDRNGLSGTLGHRGDKMPDGSEAVLQVKARLAEK
ncbi:hypothetical protein [Ferrovibrio sp.]|uniref:hypothetical protein n=1 Tax=Ferrovibrio sp. TaxID=1917215 RepID=UPI0035AEA87D